MSDNWSAPEAPPKPRARSRRRGGRTQFDRTERTVIFGALGVFVLITSVLVAILLLTREGQTSRAVETFPRNIDLWAVYPDGRVRFATLFYPNDEALLEIEPDVTTEEITAAGPLAATEDQILEEAVIGGEQIGREILAHGHRNS